jgi:hypothetical protein
MGCNDRVHRNLIENTRKRQSPTENVVKLKSSREWVETAESKKIVVKLKNSRELKTTELGEM